MRLARDAGGDAVKDLDAFRESLEPGTLEEWMALDSIEPRSERRLDAVIELLALLVAKTLNVGRDAGQQPVKFDSLLPSWMRLERKANERALTDDEVDAMFSRVAQVQQRGSINRTPGVDNRGAKRPE